MLLSAAIIIGALSFLGIVEYITRRRGAIHSEMSRKVVHMAAGMVVASWPFYLEWWEIGLMSLLAVVAICVSIQWNILRSIHNMDRRTYGEVFFALAIGFLAFLDGNSPWVFAAAMLHLGLADGLAAVVGLRFGRRHRYSVFGCLKSWAGTLTFFFVSLLITGGYLAATHTTDWALLAAVPVVSTLVENFAVFGLDNLFVPLVVAGMLKFL